MCLSLLVSRSRCILTPLLSCRLVQCVATVDFSPRGSGRKRELGGKERGATEKWECRHFFFKCFYGGRRCLDLFLFCFGPSSLLPLPPSLDLGGPEARTASPNREFETRRECETTQAWESSTNAVPLRQRRHTQKASHSCESKRGRSPFVFFFLFSIEPERRERDPGLGEHSPPLMVSVSGASATTSPSVVAEPAYSTVL